MRTRKDYQRKAILKNAVSSTKRYAGRVEKELVETAESRDGESSQEYAKKQLETGMDDVSSAAHSTLRSSYARYRTTQKAVPEDYGLDARAKALKKRLKLNFIREEAIKASWKKSSHPGSAASLYRSVSTHRNTAARTRMTLKAGKGLPLMTGKIAEALKYLGVKLVRAATSILLAMFSAGSVAIISVLFIAIVAVLLASPMGILFAGEVKDPNHLSISEIVEQANEDFGDTINELVEAHPECSEIDLKYEYEDGHSWSTYWPEVLAVFAVHSNLNTDTDVLVINEAKKQQLLDTFWVMHEIESEVTSEEIEVEVPQTDNADRQTENQDGSVEVQTVYTLHITVSSKSVDELASDYSFNEDQMDILHELLSSELRPYLVSLTSPGGVIPDGELAWPLPGYSHISTGFGEADAFGNPGHKGIDIPAPEGTPIHAAHSGTVMIASWNDSYGNQVLLDAGTGIATRYAHLSTHAVSAGQAVTAGQVIGYVGSTGNSTGYHLHFEVRSGGILVNPLQYVSAR